MKNSLGIFIISSFLFASCGKKEEPTNSGEQKQQQPVQNQGGFGSQQDQTQLQNQPSQPQNEEVQKQMNKEEQKKIEEQKRIEEEKKKKQDPTKPVVIDPTKPQNPDAQQNKEEKKSDIDFTEIWKKRCVKCHGMNGKGKVEGVPDLTRAETKNKSLSQLIDVIKNGKPAETEDGEDMPAFKNKLSPEEIEAAAKYVKGL